ncbi:hypothetical protein BH24PSE2_BH24PSE2_01990 [soil metagenome]
MPDTVDLERFRRAAAAGHPAAQFNLGLWHLRQAPPGIIPTEAHELLLAAAKQDFVPAQTLLGKLLFKLQGADQQPLQARHWLERAAEAGDPEAQYRLGELLAIGLTGQPDPTQGLAYLRRSAERGHLAARTQAAYCLEHGVGCTPDARSATQFCFIAARKDDARAQNMLGRRYAAGHTLPQNPVKALAWHLKAAAQAYPGAAAEVAKLSAELGESATRDAQALARTAIAEDEPQPAQPAPVPQGPLLVQSEQPRIAVCRGFLSQDECDHLIALGTPFLEPSRVITQSGAQEVADARTSEEMALQDQIKDLVVWEIEQRLARLASLPVEHGEPLMILHYRRGAEYRPHVDYFDPRLESAGHSLARAGQRIVTVLTYLCDVAAGGGTAFPKIGLRIAPEKGKALLFHNCKSDGGVEPLTQHAGEPVLAGEKWLATRWMRERDWRLSRST